VKARLARRPRFHIHFTPTGSSWLNLFERFFLSASSPIERFFADLTQGAIRGGSFTSVRQLITAIEDYLALRNEQPKRYRWRAEGQDILAKVQRAPPGSGGGSLIMRILPGSIPVVWLRLPLLCRAGLRPCRSTTNP
jgi:hypothetical protein